MKEEFEQLVANLRPLVQKPWELPVREWKERHPKGKVVGCFPVYSPVELVHAAGALPVGIFGAGTAVEILNADARFVSFVCSIAKSTLELGLQKKLKDFDALFFQSICDVARNLSSVFKRNFPELWIEYIHLPQNPASPAAADYYESELRRIQGKLEEFTGRKVTPQALASSIGLYNDCRRHLTHLYDLRRDHPERISTAELNVLARAFSCVAPERVEPVLRSALDAASHRTGVARDRIRVVLEGSFCEPPPLELLEAIEEAGCTIVDDDLVKGWRWFTTAIQVDGHPLRQLAKAYLESSDASSVMHEGLRPRAGRLAERVRESRAGAVVFCIAKFCEPALFDYVRFKEELDRLKIRHLVIEFEEKMWTFERSRNEIETFVESILFE